jgi:transposase
VTPTSSVTCSRCGTTADAAPPTWSLQVGGQSSKRGPEWLCEVCTRDNIRNIEGKLDHAWW